MEFEIEAKEKAIITVVGVGGAGINAVNHMIAKGLEDIAFIAADTDEQALGKSLAKSKIHIPSTFGQEISAAANPELGDPAVMESVDKFKAALGGSDMVYVVAGMGGTTGSGYAPMIAGVAKQFGSLTVGVATQPFSFEPSARLRSSAAGLEVFRKHVDSLIIIPNDRILQLLPKEATFEEVLKKADEFLYHAVKGPSDLILRSELIAVDFYDVRTVLAESGTARMAFGRA
ncbi:cell division protein FtsZ, partial [Desulfovibrio sp. OttesenSCG-928-G15]|nr:cell division protein FtsZ [Desulfovibrio sp. OttesenSCG-928-G15]